MKVFADQFPSNQEIRLMLVELLRASTGSRKRVEQLEKLAGDLEARGDTQGARKPLARLQALDTEGSDTTPKAPSRPKPGGLVFLDTGAMPAGRIVGSAGSLRLECGIGDPDLERTPRCPRWTCGPSRPRSGDRIETSVSPTFRLTLESAQPITTKPRWK